MPASGKSAGNSTRPPESTWMGSAGGRARRGERAPLPSSFLSRPLQQYRRNYSARKHISSRRRPADRPPLDRGCLARRRRPSVSVARQKRRNRLSNRVSERSGQGRTVKKLAVIQRVSRYSSLPPSLARSLLCQLKFLCGLFRWQDLRSEYRRLVGSLSLGVDIYSMPLSAFFPAQIHAQSNHRIIPAQSAFQSTRRHRHEIFIISPSSCQCLELYPGDPLVHHLTSSCDSSE